MSTATAVKVRGVRLRRTVAADLSAVDELCAQVRRLMTENDLGAHAFAIQLLLHEALANAVVHGSEGMAEGRVRCEFRAGRRWIVIEVADDGPGFDWRRASAAPPEGAATNGRGLPIYALFADRVEFNERGNRVVLRRRVDR